MLSQDFDLDGKIQVPVGFNLAILYLLRAYVFWAISLTYSEDRSFILSLFYPDHSLFFISLLIGLPAMVTFFFFSMKKQITKNWYKAIWKHLRILLLGVFFLDLLLQLLSIVNRSIYIHPMQIVQFIAGVYLCWYWLKSKRIKRFFTHWLDQ